MTQSAGSDSDGFDAITYSSLPVKIIPRPALITEALTIATPVPENPMNAHSPPQTVSDPQSSIDWGIISNYNNCYQTINRNICLSAFCQCDTQWSLE